MWVFCHALILCISAVVAVSKFILGAGGKYTKENYKSRDNRNMTIIAARRTSDYCREQPRRKWIRLGRYTRWRRARIRAIKARKANRSIGQRIMHTASMVAKRVQAFIAGAKEKRDLSRLHNMANDKVTSCEADTRDGHDRKNKKPSRRTATAKRIPTWTRMLMHMVVYAQIIGKSVAMPSAGSDDASIGTYNMLWSRRKINYWERSNLNLEPSWPQAKGDEHEPTRQTFFNIITANVQHFEGKAEVVAGWDADVIALQETKLTASDMKDAYGVLDKEGWTLIHGRPCPPAAGHGKTKRQRTNAAYKANSGGVALMVRRPRKPIQHEFTDRDKTLHDSGRWQRVKVPTTATGGCITIACVYGISGASNNTRKKLLNLSSRT